MKICEFCGCRVDEKTPACPNCSSTSFQHECPNCHNVFEGSFCNDCGIRYDAIAKTCPNCGKVYYTKACPNCGHDQVRENIQASVQSGQSYSNADSQAGRGNNTTIALVLAILGLLTCMTPFSIIAMILASKEEQAGRKSNLTKTTKVLSIMGIILFFFVLIIGTANGSRS